MFETNRPMGRHGDGAIRVAKLERITIIERRVCRGNLFDNSMGGVVDIGKNPDIQVDALQAELEYTDDLVIKTPVVLAGNLIAGPDNEFAIAAARL